MAGDRRQTTWLVVGASRGIGHEFVNQLLARGDVVYATVRKDAASFWPEAQEQGRCKVFICDIVEQQSIDVGSIQHLPPSLLAILTIYAEELRSRPRWASGDCNRPCDRERGRAQVPKQGDGNVV